MTGPAMNATPTATAKKTPGCRGIAAHVVDDAVAGVLPEALTPEQVALALAAAGEVTSQHQRAGRAAELAVERARYEADRAERAFSQVEPENRLVARTLEARWKPGSPRSPTPGRPCKPPRPPCRRYRTGTAWPGLPPPPALWHAATTTPRDRKWLPRTLIADVTLLPEADRAKARIGIRWHTGAAGELVIDRPRPTGVPAPTPAPATELIRELGPVTSNTGLVAILHQRGYLTRRAARSTSTPSSGSANAYQIPAPSPYRGTEISVAEAARRLGRSPGVVYYWIETGQLDARRSPGRRLCIPCTPATEAGCRARITSSGHLNPAARRTRPRQHH